MSNLRKYTPFTPEAAQQDQLEVEKGNVKDFIKPNAGVNCYRFLPAIHGPSPFVVVHKHFVMPPGGGRAIVMNCPRIMKSRDCPICRTMDRMKTSAIPSDMELADKMFPSMRVLCNVIDRDNEAIGPQKMEIGKSIHKQLVDILMDTRNGGDFTDPGEDGFDIVIKREGSGRRDTKYYVSCAKGSTPLHAEAAQSDLWIDQQADLRPYAYVPSDQEVQKILGDCELFADARRGGGRREVRGEVVRQPRPRTAADDLVEDE